MECKSGGASCKRLLGKCEGSNSVSSQSFERDGWRGTADKGLETRLAANAGSNSWIPCPAPIKVHSPARDNSICSRECDCEIDQPLVVETGWLPVKSFNAVARFVCHS